VSVKTDRAFQAGQPSELFHRADSAIHAKPPPLCRFRRRPALPHRRAFKRSGCKWKLHSDHRRRQLDRDAPEEVSGYFQIALT